MSPTAPQFMFDFGSPNAFLSHEAIPAIEKRTGVKFEYVPVLLGGIFKATNNRSPAETLAGVKNKREFHAVETERFIRRFDVKPYNWNPFFPVNTLQLMRMAVGLQQRQPAQFLPFVEGIFKAMWVDGANLGDHAVVAETLTALGLDAAAVMALTQDEEIKALLKRETELAVQRGLFGMPTMFVGGEMFWGQDRLDFVREALGQR